MVTHSQLHSQYAHRVVKLLDGAVVTENIRQIA
jgi:putative ABC transport system ATP-binding protein